MSERRPIDDIPPDAPISEEERRAAERLARALDDESASSEGAVERELWATAMMIRASHQEAELSTDHRRQLMDELFQVSQDSAARPAAGRGRRKVGRVLALAATVLLVAGAALLFGHRMAGQSTGPGWTTAALSRPSNDLIGRPFEDRAGASRRLDRVFSDRLSGYREVRFGGGVQDGEGN